MLSRAFMKPKRSPKNGDNITRSESILHEYEDCIVGFMDDIPLVVCAAIKGYQGARSEPTLREVLRASVGVIGESCLGITEKVVFLGGKVCALKRFREVAVGKREFGRRLQRVAQISGRCEHLVPVLAYLYTKRIKFVLCDYYPMGSLHDLLSGEHKQRPILVCFKALDTTTTSLCFLFNMNRSFSSIFSQHRK